MLRIEIDDSVSINSDESVPTFSEGKTETTQNAKRKKGGSSSSESDNRKCEEGGTSKE